MWAESPSEAGAFCMLSPAPAGLSLGSRRGWGLTLRRGRSLKVVFANRPGVLSAGWHSPAQGAGSNGLAATNGGSVAAQGPGPKLPAGGGHRFHFGGGILLKQPCGTGPAEENAETAGVFPMDSLSQSSVRTRSELGALIPHVGASRRYDVARPSQGATGQSSQMGEGGREK